MVMETPTPQCVGQEFVRQYYTLLHEAPHVMHRFYSHDSSFVHGGIEKPGEEMPPIMGQMAIHKKIMSLNFRDCHAKIRQVDSQATIDNAVVVQVVGELSNAGQPMRRFMQTFVLAPQSPKKYYVHNDIFRYQDEVFHDAILEAEPDTSETEAVIVYEQPSAVNDNADPVLQLPASNGSSCVAHVAGIFQEPVIPVVDGALETNVSDSNMNVEPQNVRMDSKPLQEPVANVTATPGSSAVGAQPPSTSLVTNTVSQQPTESREATKQVSWAALASKGTASSATPVPAKPQATVKPELKPEAVSSVTPLPQRIGTVDRGSVDRDSTIGIEGDGSITPSDTENGSTRRRFPDNLQVFVGNLPHNFTDVELREFFLKFGPVIDVRINRRPTRDVPNFGFVVFDCPETVHKVLDARPLFIFDDKYRLNVEEKKQQTDYRAGGMSRGAPRGAYRGGFNSGQGASGGRGGWRGGRGGGRGVSGDYNSGSFGRTSGDENSPDDRSFGHTSQLNRHLQ